MGKKIAFIGSSGGNLYKQGGNDLPAMMKELCGQTKAADMEIVFVQYVLASGSLDNVGPDSPATLFTWNGTEVQPVFQGTLREVDAEAAKVDAQLAKKINELLKRPDIDGIVITHGTDTMEETAYFLNLTVKSDKPVVLVGAMRPSTALSADGPLNLYNAVVTAAATESKDKGVLIAMNGLILGAESTVKMNTVDVQTFQAPNSGALGYVLNGKVFYNQITLKKHTTRSVFDVTRLTSLPKVGIVYSYSNIEADMMTPLLNNGYKGIIHAGVGNGNIHKNIFPSLIDARKKGILVVRSSRVPTGPTTLDAEVDDAKYQFVASQELNPQKSRVLLMLALTKTTDWKQIQQYFNEY